MGTKKQETLKEEIFGKTKRFRTLSDVNPDLDLEQMTKLGIKFKFDKSKDYFRKSSKEIKLLKEEQEQQDLIDEYGTEHLVTRRQKIAYVIVAMDQLPDADVESIFKFVEDLTGDE